MVHVTIEHMIMIPVLILQILAFPIVTSAIMNVWVNSRQTLALQDITSHLGSAVQQLYFSLNHPTIPVNTTLIDLPNLPTFIENYYYEGNATLKPILDPALNSSQVLMMTLRLATTGITATTSVILGSNVSWQDSTFLSNSTNACISAVKLPNQTISLRFGD
jgi:hypothetical protein